MGPSAFGLGVFVCPQHARPFGGPETSLVLLPAAERGPFPSLVPAALCLSRKDAQHLSLWAAIWPHLGMHEDFDPQDDLLLSWPAVQLFFWAESTSSLLPVQTSQGNHWLARSEGVSPAGGPCELLRN